MSKPADLDDLNDYNRNLYRDEVAGLIERFNSVLKAGQPKLYAPDIKFNRNIGKWAGQKFHAQTGEPLDDNEYEQHLKEFHAHRRKTRSCCSTSSQREEVDRAERRRARSAGDDWRAAEVGNQSVRSQSI